MSSLGSDEEISIAVALAGMITGALAEAVGEIVKEFRRNSGSDFDKRLDVLEAKAIRSIENAPIDGLPENVQLFLVEQARAIVGAVFADARRKM